MTRLAFAFALVLSFAQIGETYAKKTCDCGTAGHETECCWEITEVTKDGKTEKVLTITPGVDENGAPYENVVMKGYNRLSDISYKTNGYITTYASNAPWSRQDVTKVIIKEGINNVGNNAFSGETKIKSADMEYVEKIGDGAFYIATSLKDANIANVKSIMGAAFAGTSSLSNIYVPNLNSIGTNSFEGTGLKSIDLPNVSDIPWAAFFGARKLEYIGFSTTKDSEGCLVNAKGERLKSGNNTCLTAINIAGLAFNNTKIPNCSADGSGCGSCGYTKATGYQYVKRGLGCVKHCGDGLVGKGNKCVAGGCGEGYIQVEDFCNRIRYTPAEAAPLLNDNNMVTITFRK